MYNTKYHNNAPPVQRGIQWSVRYVIRQTKIGSSAAESPVSEPRESVRSVIEYKATARSTRSATAEGKAQYGRVSEITLTLANSLENCPPEIDFPNLDWKTQ